MPGYLLHLGATVLCSHGGQAQPASASPRVTVTGQAIALQPIPYTVTGCGLAPNSPPCVTAQWTTAATRILSSGQAPVLFDSQAICSPTGQPLQILQTQTRVTGS